MRSGGWRSVGRWTVALSLVWLCAGVAEARSLHWEELAVTARLDAEGVLHVSELHGMVFTGDWNGGERAFRLEAFHRLELDRLVRIDPETGLEREVVEGNLDEVDQYDWVESGLLRWRSRLPSDPVFVGERIDYRIDYKLKGILKARDALFLLDHDFAFSDRYGEIQRFTLDLELDPVWSQPVEMPLQGEAESLYPGSGFPVYYELVRNDSSWPASVPRPLPGAPIYLLFAAAMALAGELWLRFRRGQAALGRYDFASAPRPPSREWLEKHLFSMQPEVVGTLWDGLVGPPEVAAVLARLEMEGKLESEVIPKKSRFAKDTLRLRLTQGRGGLHGYDLALIRKLFFDDREETDTDAIRKHYKKTGFSPVRVIETDLKRKVRELPTGRPLPPWPPGALARRLFAVVVALLVIEAVLRARELVGLAVFTGILLVPVLLFGFIGAYAWRTKLRRLDGHALIFLLPVVLLFLALGGLIRFALAMPLGLPVLPTWFGVAAMALLPVAFLAWFLHVAAARESAKRIRQRQELASLRDWFKEELDKETPALEDEWLPYLFAFGLHKDVDRWFQSFGGTSSSGLAGSSSSIGSYSSSSGGGGFTGGGGAFGGAGATAAWGVAATGLAAGVAAPSSSSSGGGGGSSSGGGGGGGW